MYKNFEGGRKLAKPSSAFRGSENQKRNSRKLFVACQKQYVAKLKIIEVSYLGAHKFGVEV
jgi:hypothetical protein